MIDLRLQPHNLQLALADKVRGLPVLPRKLTIRERHIEVAGTERGTTFNRLQLEPTSAPRHL